MHCAIACSWDECHFQKGNSKVSRLVEKRPYVSQVMASLYRSRNRCTVHTNIGRDKALVSSNGLLVPKRSSVNPYPCTIYFAPAENELRGPSTTSIPARSFPFLSLSPAASPLASSNGPSSCISAIPPPHSSPPKHSPFNDNLRISP
jgi:hypothetical protein